jgi:hypothetical protein
MAANKNGSAIMLKYKKIKNDKLKPTMPQQYNFYNIFTYALQTGAITPKYNILINNALLPVNVPITPNTYTGGVNLFQYVGRSFAGEWNPQTQQLTIERFY